ncbi:MAG: hypothetical protein HZA94_03205 [Candidatus Vogelbacteria bacterium]|nr:hypothetical protein [Candidatus Vogelbacteria bacterium]
MKSHGIILSLVLFFVLAIFAPALAKEGYEVRGGEPGGIEIKFTTKGDPDRDQTPTYIKIGCLAGTPTYSTGGNSKYGPAGTLVLGGKGVLSPDGFDGYIFESSIVGQSAKIGEPRIINGVNTSGGQLSEFLKTAEAPVCSGDTPTMVVGLKPKTSGAFRLVIKTFPFSATQTNVINMEVEYPIVLTIKDSQGAMYFDKNIVQVPQIWFSLIQTYLDGVSTGKRLNGGDYDNRLTIGFPATEGSHKIGFYVFGYNPKEDELAVDFAKPAQSVVDWKIERINPVLKIEPRRCASKYFESEYPYYHPKEPTLRCNSYKYDMVYDSKIRQWNSTGGPITENVVLSACGSQGQCPSGFAPITQRSGSSISVLGCVPWWNLSIKDRLKRPDWSALQDEVLLESGNELKLNREGTEPTNPPDLEFNLDYKKPKNPGLYPFMRGSFLSSGPTTGFCQAPVEKCGNGKIDAGEKCDDGAKNGTKDSKCNLSCELLDVKLYVDGAELPVVTAVGKIEESYLFIGKECGKEEKVDQKCMIAIDKADVEKYKSPDKDIKDSAQRFILKPYQVPGETKGRYQYSLLIDSPVFGSGGVPKKGLTLVLISAKDNDPAKPLAEKQFNLLEAEFLKADSSVSREEELSVVSEAGEQLANLFYTAKKFFSDWVSRFLGF